MLGQRRRRRLDELALQRALAHVHGLLNGGVFHRHIGKRVELYVNRALHDILRSDGRFEVLGFQHDRLANLDRFALAVYEVAGIVAIDQLRENEVLLKTFKTASRNFLDVDKSV